MTLSVMGIHQRGARLRALALVTAVVALSVVPHRFSGAAPGDPPSVTITAPQDNYVFKPGEKTVITGTAADGQGVLGVKLEYWLLNRLVAEKIAECTGCGSASATWRHEPRLDPGYYVVSARTVSLTGVHSDYRSRRFATGLESVPPLPVDPEPSVPDPNDPPPEIEPPEVETPETGDLIPGSEKPVPIGGSGPPGTVIISDGERGDLASVDTDENGRWTARVRLPSGTYSVSARVTDNNGNVSPPSEIVSFDVDSKRPIAVFSQDDRVFLPTQEVVVDGAARDDRAISMVVIEYWLWGERVQIAMASCDGCGTTLARWSHRPALGDPGHYTVRATAYDSAGNPSHRKTMTVTTTGISLQPR